MPIPSRFEASDAALLVIDVQDRLVVKMPSAALMIANAVRLVRAAELLDVPRFATEQYPEGLGPTVGPLAALLPERPSKRTFHCCEVPGLVEGFRGSGVRHVALAGIEAHVCVAQTALELLRIGFEVQVPADAVASRSEVDWRFALRRLEAAGAVVTTTEAVLFEWLGSSLHPQFKAVSALVKAHEPPEGHPASPRRDRT